MPDTLVELEDIRGNWFTLAGPGQGDRGIVLGTDVDGIYDAPVKTIQNSHAFQTGSTYGGKRNLQRDIVFGVYAHHDDGDKNWSFNDSEWRKGWSYEQDCKLWITTEDSRRYLKLRMSQHPEFKPEHDPNGTQIEKVVMTCVANDPWWYEADDVTDLWESRTSTLNGSINYGTVSVSNPTDVPIWPKYVVHGAAKPMLPDFSFGDDRYERALIDADRKLWLPKISAGDTIVYDTDEEADQATSRLKIPYWQQMKAVTFCYPIPPYTKKIQLPVGMTLAAAGLGIQVRCPRPWSRPWGLQ
ncbi:phage tail protein [Rhodococcus erythropolis]|uniref:phage tail protein n=1 Tax=Rhodococcus erythropolis TaxID=1833 RepID=UPI0036717495